MLAFYNGEFIPADQAVIPLHDAGYVLGTTVVERMRTFAGKLFGIEAHFERLQRSLHIVDVSPKWTLDELTQFTNELVQANFAELARGDDLSVSILVSPGPIETYLSPAPEPLVIITAEPIAFDGLFELYQQGQRLRISSVQQTPLECWPTELKCRSRMHYFLADKEARQVEAGSRALMVTADGHVTEATTANLLVYHREEGLITPPLASVLPGVTLANTAEIATAMNLPFSYRPLTPADIANADEVMLTSTTPCVLPAVFLNGEPIGAGKPGEVFTSLITAWSDRAGIDLREQSRIFEHRVEI